MDKEMERFQQDLLKSVRQMKAGKAARTTQVALSTNSMVDPICLFEV